MWLTRFALARPVTVSMVFICAVVTGIAAARLLPLEFFPEVQFPGIFVQVLYPGSSPEEVERNITRPLEESLATIDGIDLMQSTSSENQSSVFLLFNWATNAKIKGVEAREKMDSIRDQLPDDVQRIFVFTGNTADQPIVEARVSATTDLSDSWQVLNRQLKQRLERIPGVSKVEIHGVGPKTYQIRLLPERVAAYNIDTNDLLNKLQNVNLLIAAGEIKDGRRNLRVTVNEQFQAEADIGKFVVNNAGIVLSDIADIRLAPEEIDVGRHLNREYAVGIRVTKEAGANLVNTSSEVIAELENISELADFDNIELFVIENTGREVITSLKDIAWAGFIGFLLSSLVLFLFLRDLRLTFIVSLAVPFSLMITLAVLYLTGFTLNLLSMMGLMLAIGMLVDNAVVVSESIFNYRKIAPDKPIDAVLNGVKDVGLPVVAGTLTTAIVFLPNLIGEKVSITIFLQHVAISIVVALAASLFIATTIIPLLLSRVPTKPAPQQKPITEQNQSHGFYSRCLAWLLHRPLAGAALTLVLAGSIVIPAQFVKSDFFGNDENGRLEIIYNILGEHHVDRVEQEVARMEEFLFSHMEELDIVNVYSFFTTNQAGSILLLKDEEQRQHTLAEIRKYVEDNKPRFAISKPGFERIRGSENGFTLMLQGEDASVLYGLYEQLDPLFKNIPGVVETRPLIPIGRSELQISLNAQRLQQLNLSPQIVAQTIGTALRKRPLRTFRNEQGEIDISVSLFEGDTKATVEDLAALPILLPGNRQTRLDSLAEFNIQRSLPQVVRNNRQTGLSLRLEYRKEEATSEQVQVAVKNIMASVNLPTGYTWQFGQQVLDSSRDINVMLINMILALLMIFVVMAALFESLIFPLAAISSIYFGVVGVYWYYLATGTSMNIMGMIGLLVLMGVVVNNAIVLIHRISTYRERGHDRIDAIVHAANDRIRPIAMTVLTTILGLLPLSLGDTTIGAGGPPYFPMARAVIGGLAFSTVATLICLPVIYLGLDWLRNYYGRLWHLSAKPGVRINFRKITLEVKN